MRVRKRLADHFGHKISLEIEPGRYLVAESGYLVSEIRAIKQMGGNTFYLLDAGFNNLARPILYGAYHPMSICAGAGDGAGRQRAGRRRRRPVVRDRSIFSRRRRADSSQRGSCRPRRWATIW